MLHACCFKQEHLMSLTAHDTTAYKQQENTPLGFPAVLQASQHAVLLLCPIFLCVLLPQHTAALMHGPQDL